MNLRTLLRSFAVTLPLLALSVPAMNNHARADAPSPQARMAWPHYYLALGAIAYGYQQSKENDYMTAHGTPAPASVFLPNYASDLAASLQTLAPSVQLVNYACHGATSTAMLTVSGCASANPPHDLYSGTMISAAVAFLTQHPGTDLITLDPAAEDVGALIDNCALDITCINAGTQATLATIRANLRTMLNTLRAAAPRARIIVVDSYNPVAALLPATNSLFFQYNALLALEAFAHRARPADLVVPFNVAQPQPQTLCTLTAICGPLGDAYPTDAGNQVIANVLWRAADYDRMRAGDTLSDS